MKRQKAFTLIEVLVVVSIIALLVSILIPTLSKARGQARRVSCASQLHQVGIAMLSYLHDSRDHMPWASDMPSIGPGPLTDPTPIYFSDVLKPHLKNQISALNCPGDVPGLTNRGAPNQGLSYFQSERSSYGYRTALRGLTPTRFNQMPHGRPGHEHQHPNDAHAPSTIWFACDYENFHGQAGENGARRYVYIDGHVADYEN
jgi:prepilin-type N-terminal cleavage/methylation domain-containing protein